jgi:hypothetical protein
MRYRRVQTAFTTGELSETLRGRKDVQLYYLGLEKGLNVIARPQGSVRQRPGSYHVDTFAPQAISGGVGGGPAVGAETAVGGVRLADFVFSASQAYLVAIQQVRATIYDTADDSLVDYVTLPYATADLRELAWQQVADTMLIVHPDYAGLRELYRTSSDWLTGDFAFESAPQYKYHQDRATTIASSGTSGSVTLTAASGSDNDIFVAGHVGTQWTVAGKRVTITAVGSATSATATIVDTLDSGAATTDWTEQASSSVRGGFRAIAYFGDRTWLGGTRDAPFSLWASRVGAPYDFLEGGVNDNDPLSVLVTSGRADPILHLVAGSGGLEVFTEGGEFYIPSGPGTPITPTRLAVIPQTSYGSRAIRPVRLDSQTIFVQRQGGAMREFVYSDVEQAYQAVPLTIRAQHLLPDPVSLAQVAGGFGLPVDFLMAVNADGTGAFMSSLRSEEVTAWTQWTSERTLHDVRSVLSKVYIATTDGAGAFWLERLSESAIFDAQVDDTTGTATDTWGPYAHLAGLTVDVFADGYWRGDFTADGSGNLTLDGDYLAINAGLAIEVAVRPMPPEVEQDSLLGMAIRPFKCELSYLGSSGLRVNGYVIPDRPFDAVTETAPTVSTNVSRVRLGGWQRGKTQAPVITREGPSPFEIVAFAVDYRIGAG